MDFKQRILTALNHEEPDRVPVMGLIMDPATVNHILGRDNPDISAVLQQPESRAGLMQYMNASWYDIYCGNFADALEAAIKLGFDANWTIYALMQAVEDPQAKLGISWRDVHGRVWEMGDVEGAGLTFNYSRPLCITEDEWEVWVADKGPMFDELVKQTASFHKELAARYGDRIMPIGYAAPGIFENSWQPIGFVNFTHMVYENPDFVRKVVAFHTEWYLKCIDAVMQSDVEVVIGGDDLAQKTGPLMRPELIDRLYGESYRRVSEMVHSRGRKLIWHSCGNIYRLLDKFIDWGFDGIITMEPTAGVELGKVWEMVGHRLALIGNLDVSYLLVRGTREEIEDAVRQAIRDAAGGGGYILSACHSHPLVDGTRLGWMVEAAHRYGRYPLA